MKIPARFRLASLSILLAASVAFSGRDVARADTLLFDNFSNGDIGFRVITPTSWDAQRFNSDAVNLLLTNVMLRLSSAGGSGTFFLSLYSDAANQPGVALSTLFSGTDPGGGNVLFGGLSQALAPNTNYWLVLGENPGASLSLGWGVAGTSSGTGGGFQTTAAFNGNAGGNWLVLSGNPYLTQITAAPFVVPEPGSGAQALLGLLLGGGGCARCRVRRDYSKIRQFGTFLGSIEARLK